MSRAAGQTRRRDARRPRRPVRGCVQILVQTRVERGVTWIGTRARSSARRPSRGVAFSLSLSLSLFFRSSPFPSRAPSRTISRVARLLEEHPSVVVRRRRDKTVAVGVGDRHARDALYVGCYHMRRRELFPAGILRMRPASFKRELLRSL